MVDDNDATVEIIQGAIANFVGMQVTEMTRCWRSER